MEPEILVTVASGLLQLLGLCILASVFTTSPDKQHVGRERLLVLAICCLGVVTMLAGWNQLDCSLSSGLTVSVLTLGAVARVGLDMRSGAHSTVY